MGYELTSKKKNKEVRYLNKDFSQFRNNLIEFSKQYFPNTYQDFNESSPGMMFIEMASYVGDVMSYYVDSQFKESLLGYSEELRTLYSMAQSFGYKPRLSAPSSTKLEFFQLVPATGTGNNVAPDYNYALNIKSGTRVETSDGVVFRTIEDCDMRYESSRSPREVEIFERDSNTDTPTYYYIRKEVRAQSGNITDEDFTFGGAKKYDKVLLSNSNVIDIISCTDSDGNTWYEVDSLAQDTIFDEIENNSDNDPELSQYSSDVPYILRLKRVSKRFTTFRRPDGKTELRFGAGISDNADEEIIPNPDNVGSSLGQGISRLDESFDPSNFLKTQTFGLAPSNTTLTVEYNYGGAVEHNVASNSIISFTRKVYTISTEGLDAAKKATSEASIKVTNELPASGGSSTETLTQVKENAAAYFNAQNRAVTKADYITRAYSLPQKYGNIAKAYIVQDEQLELDGQLQVIDGQVIDTRTATKQPNPLALNMYLLGYNADKKLVALNRAVKQNLKIYLSQYRILTDAINIKDGYVINIGVKFNIIVKRGMNKNDVLFKSIQKVKEFFAPDKWQINQPIVLSDLAYQISLVDGVVSLVPPEVNNPNKDLILIENKFETGQGYSGNIYDVRTASQAGVIYPSLDPSIFELKFPNSDIEGKVVGDR